MLYSFEEWELDVERYELRRAGKPIKLEPQVFSVLAYLVQHRNRVLSKQELLSHLWPGQYIGDSALERCIMAARKAVGDSGGKQRVIKTFHRRGYRFVVPVTEHLPPDSPLPPTEPAVPPPRQPPRYDDVGHAASFPPVEDAIASTHLPPGTAVDAPPCPVISRRKVTVLSCAIADAPEDFKVDTSESLQSYLRPLFDHIAAYVQSYGGMTALYRDNGLVGLFGISAPYEEHALRAVKAAVALQASLERTPFGLDVLSMPLELCMGLHTGDIVGKRFGDDPQRIYMAVGNTLQFAANLQACTLPGVILASEATYSLVQHAVCGKVAGLVALQSGLRHTTAYHLSHLLTPSDTSPLTSLPISKASKTLD
jgi:DNA-binding winged helix-turn-helix (wHTH) protein/class 3 adenylate cyclase